MNRRTVMKALAGAPLVLGGCQQGMTIASEVLSDVSLITGAFQPLVGELATVTTVPATTIATALGYVNDAVNVGKSIVATMRAAAAAPLIQQISSDVSGLLTVAGTPPTSTALAAAVPGIGPILSAASVLVPVIEAAAGIATSVASASPTEIANAKLVLAAAAKG